MSDELQKHIERRLADLAARDPELAEEVRSKVASPRYGPSGERVFETLGLSAQPADSRDPLAAGRVAEAIVKAHERPVLLIRDNTLVDEFAGPDSAIWRERLMKAKPVLDPLIPTVGRLEVTNHPSRHTWIGTGWLVSSDVVVTNRHVAVEFARRDPHGYVFRVSPGGTMTAGIDFLEEHDRSGALEFPVAKILWMSGFADPDIAFLQLGGNGRARQLPAPTRLATSAGAGDFVATIGYPARDDSFSDQDLLRRIFRDVYDKKRLAPGQILTISQDDLQHDCSTLGGNSGSLIANIATGEAVALHYAGTVFTANYAVPAALVHDRLQRVLKGELPGAIRVAPPANGTTISPVQAPPAISINGGELTRTFSFPIQVTVRIGDASGPPITTAYLSGDQSAGDPQTALEQARAALAGNSNVLNVRLGYRFRRGWITDERVIVVELRKKRSRAELREARQPLISERFGGLGVDVRTASLVSQLREEGLRLAAMVEEGINRGHYQRPRLMLQAVDEDMRAVFHVSPDAGWPTFRDFLSRVQRQLTATMYEFDAEHIRDEVSARIQGGNRTFDFITQFRTPKQDPMAAFVETLETRLGQQMEHTWASVGAELIFPIAYHIKVAVRDRQEFWLSSGNWKNSGQPEIDPIADGTTSTKPLLDHNREWHAVIDNPSLASLFDAFIRFDIDEAHRVPRPEAVPAEPPLPDVFVPIGAMALERRAFLARYHKPLEVNRRLKVQPLLTPDNYAQFAAQLIESAERRIFFQNQSFSLLKTDENGDRNEPEFLELMRLLKDRQREIEVKIIIRDLREFGREALEDQQALLERLQDFGFDMDFVKLQHGCHTKGIIVDSSAVLLGSHNWTNTGALYNRDASLIVYDPEVAQYFESIFLYDWEHLAHQQADEEVAEARLAGPGEPTPPGMTRVSLREILVD